MKTNNLSFIGFIVFLITAISCSNDDDVQQLPEPTMSELEIGSGDNQGVIGRDFHFNAEVVAGGTIDQVKINIDPRDGETYSKDWSFEIIWDEFKGFKNTTVHKHFDIPEDAPEGKFDFQITVTDENGTKLEETYEVNLIDPANLPVDPYLYIWDFSAKGGDYYFVNELLENPEDIIFTKGDTLTSSATIKKVKGEGTMYLIFIKKSADHLPTIVDDIDFSKVVVYDLIKHESEDVFSFSNRDSNYDGDWDRTAPELVIGATADNNDQHPNLIAGGKAWENGEYYFGIVYTNTTYNISVYHYIPFTMKGF